VKRADIVSGMVVFLFSVFLFYESSKLQFMYSTSIPGTGFLPYWLSLGMAGLGLLLVVNAWRQQTAGSSITWPAGRGLSWILATIVALGAYTLLMTVVGYILSSFALMALLIRMLSSYRWYTVAAASLATAVVVYAIFAIWLQMELPTGLLIIP
jgi:hypothetical protein